MNLDKFVVFDSFTINEVIETLQNNHERTVIVLNNCNKVIGVISQGDIILALSEGIDIYSNISQIVNNSFIYLNEKDLKKAYKFFKDKQISLLPIVTDNFELIDIITIKDIFDYLEK